MEKRVLFLYINKTTGHHKAAEGLKAALETIDPSVQATLLDFVSQSYPLFSTIASKTYLGILQKTPQIWDYLYDNRNVEEGTRELRNFLNVITALKLKKFVDTHHPEVLVCTQAFPCATIAQQKKKGKIRLPLIGVVTDFHAHSYWLHPEVDLYLVASEETKASMVERGIEPERIRITGIPIHPDFNSSLSKQKARRQLNLDPRLPTILIMGGGHGLCPMEEIIEALKDLNTPHQILVVTGANKRLWNKLNQRYGEEKRMTFFHYRPDVARLMDAASLLITKAGGLTSSEAMAKGVPMLIVNPLPGQEERNVRFLLKHKAAVLTPTIEDLRVTVQNLLNDSNALKTLSGNAKRLGTPNSGLQAAQIILNQTHQKVLNRLTSSRSDSGLPSNISIH